MAYRIDEIQLNNFGPIRSFSCDHFAPINLIIGERRTGKTTLLKAMYSALRAIEEYKRGKNARPFHAILAERLRWTFQSEQLGDLVSKSGGPLRMEMVTCSDTVQYQFSAAATHKVAKTVPPEKNKAGHSVFIPEREVLTAMSNILDSRLIDSAFGHDDAEHDLAKLISLSPLRHTTDPAVCRICKRLSDIINGRVLQDQETGRWFFKNRRNQRFALSIVSAAVKKIAALEILLSSGWLNENSVLFFDDFEGTLQPDDICELLEVVTELARTTGIRVFISSGSYILLKKRKRLIDTRSKRDT